MRRMFACLAALALVAAVAPIASAAEDGKALYDSKCAMCHGKDGAAKPMAKGSRNFSDAEFQKANSAEQITALVEAGKNKMPAYKEKLSAEQIKAVAEYVKTLGAK